MPECLVKRIPNHSEAADITGVYDRYSYDREKRKALEQRNRRLRAIRLSQRAGKVIRFGR